MQKLVVGGWLIPDPAKRLAYNIYFDIDAGLKVDGMSMNELMQCLRYQRNKELCVHIFAWQAFVKHLVKCLFCNVC